MSKKYLEKGTPLRNISDPQIAKPHKKGDVFSLCQFAKDNIWGQYAFCYFPKFPLYFEQVKYYYNETIKVLEECRKVEVHPENKQRFLSYELVSSLENFSSYFLIFNKLAFEYLCEEFLFIINNVEMNHKREKLEMGELETFEKLKKIKKFLKSRKSPPPILLTLFKRRDIIVHPTRERLYNSDKNEWSNINTCWVLSGKIEINFLEIEKFIEELYNAFERYQKENAKPGKLNVERGIKSLDQYKKYKND